MTGRSRRTIARSLRVAIVAAASIALDVGTAVAQPAAPVAPEDDAKARARALANRGYELFQEGRYEEANGHFREAERIFHATTIVVMIGETYEHLDRLADAEAMYALAAEEKLASYAPQAFRDAQATARERLAALAPRVPRIELRLRRPLDGRRMEVTVDGVPVAASRLPGPLGVDPGTRVIEVRIAGAAPARHVVTLVEGGRSVLEIDGEAGAGDVTPNAAEAPPPGDPSSGLVIPAIASLAVGGGGLVLGTVAGVIALGKRSDLDDRCLDGRCFPEDRALADEVSTAATWSTVGFVVGGVGIAAGAVLLWADAASTPERPGAAVHLEPGLGAARLRGRF